MEGGTCYEISSPHINSSIEAGHSCNLEVELELFLDQYFLSVGPNYLLIHKVFLPGQNLHLLFTAKYAKNDFPLFVLFNKDFQVSDL